LSGVLLFYFLAVILVITLAPFHFQRPTSVTIDLDGSPFDIVANVLLFFPLGFLFPLARPIDREPSPIEILGLGMLFSGFIETAQVFEPGRFPSAVDIVTNATGAMLGAMAVRYATGRVSITARDVGRFSLEIPLVGLFYLLLPLLLATSFQAAREPLYLLALAPVVFIATRLLASLQRHHFGPSRLMTDAQAGVAAAAWVLLGTFPVLLVNRVAGAALIVAAGVATWILAAKTPAVTRDRRFEGHALAAIAPLVAAHILCVVFLPLTSGLGRWQLHLGFTGARGNIDQQTSQLLVPAASITLLGYLLAEARGRRELPFEVDIVAVAPACAVVAVAIEMVRGFQPAAGASVTEFSFIVAAGVLGAGIYHSQRQHVRWIIANRAQ
jgi:VanZ family protein